MDKTQIVKLVIRIIASTAVGNVVGNVIKMNTPANLTLTNKVLSKTGEFIITSMISEKGADYVMKSIDQLTPVVTPITPVTQEETK